MVPLRVLVPLWLVAALASCANVEPRQTLLDPGAGTGSISGRVVGLGVPRPRVTVRTLPNVGTTITDNLGQYTLVGIPAQKVRVLASETDFDQRGRDVQVLPGEVANGDIFLDPTGASGTLLGKVTDDGINGIADVDITTLPPTQGVTTNFQGEFALVALPPGQYQVDARRDGYFPGRTFVSVFGGEISQTRMTVTRRNDGVISGTALNQAGGSAGARNNPVKITLFRDTRKEQRIKPDQQFNFSALIEPPQFRYSFENLPTGRYILQAEANGFVPGVKEVEVVPPRLANGDIILTTDGATGSVAGTIYDPSDQPRAGAVVAVGPAGGPSGVTTVTGLDGRFFVANLTPGIYQVSAVASLFTTRTTIVAVPGGATADGSLALDR